MTAAGVVGCFSLGGHYKKKLGILLNLDILVENIVNITGIVEFVAMPPNFFEVYGLCQVFQKTKFRASSSQH